MLISSLSSTPILILRLEFSWVRIYIGSEVVAYITVEYLHGKQYNSVRLFIGQSVDVNGSIQYVCMYLFIYSQACTIKPLVHIINKNIYCGGSTVSITQLCTVSYLSSNLSVFAMKYIVRIF